MNKNSNSLLSAGVITAFAASLCCITPVLALISGVSGIAATFSWLESFRPFLIGITALVLAFAWYQKLKPKADSEIECDCEEDEKPSFMQSQLFLGIVTVFTVVMLAFPSYSDVFYPTNDEKEVVFVNTADFQDVTINISGMTCDGCASHIENEVNKLPGIVSVDARFEDANAKISFDHSKVSLAQIEDAINDTGYEVVGED